MAERPTTNDERQMLVVRQKGDDMKENGDLKRPLIPVCRGVRGAIAARENSREAILAATRELLEAIVAANNIDPEDIASIYFTATIDLNATYPALAARQLGWLDLALLCGQELEVPDSLRRCIRVLLHWNTSKSVKEIVHVYLGEAVVLRPDRVVV
jgi:chorismate mutase